LSPSCPNGLDPHKNSLDTLVGNGVGVGCVPLGVGVGESVTDGDGVGLGVEKDPRFPNPPPNA